VGALFNVHINVSNLLVNVNTYYIVYVSGKIGEIVNNFLLKY
jgi:hypothetical protein